MDLYLGVLGIVWGCVQCGVTLTPHGIGTPLQCKAAIQNKNPIRRCAVVTGAELGAVPQATAVPGRHPGRPVAVLGADIGPCPPGGPVAGRPTEGPHPVPGLMERYVVF